MRPVTRHLRAGGAGGAESGTPWHEHSSVGRRAGAAGQAAAGTYVHCRTGGGGVCAPPSAAAFSAPPRTLARPGGNATATPRPFPES